MTPLSDSLDETEFECGGSLLPIGCVLAVRMKHRQSMTTSVHIYVKSMVPSFALAHFLVLAILSSPLHLQAPYQRLHNFLDSQLR
jgi:hypothetical protein